MKKLLNDYIIKLRYAYDELIKLMQKAKTPEMDAILVFDILLFGFIFIVVLLTALLTFFSILFLTLMVFVIVAYCRISLKNKRLPSLDIFNISFFTKFKFFEKIIFIIIFILLAYLVFIYPTSGINLMNNIVSDNVNNGYFAAIANQTFKEKYDNESIARSILDWQNENMFDIQGYYQINTYNSFPKSINLFSNVFLVLKLPPDICLRTPDQVDSKWTLISKEGMCGEFAKAFCQLANYTNLSYRTIYFIGEDHTFNEAYFNNSWNTIDSSIGGFNVDPYMYEKDWGYNIVFAIAKYPNGSTDDVTYRYSNTSIVSINVLDENNNKIDNANISIIGFKNNNNLTNPVLFKSNSNGLFNMYLKQGHYLISASNGSYSGISNIIVNQSSTNEFNVTINKIVINKDGLMSNTFYEKIISDFGTYLLELVIILLMVYDLMLIIKLNVILRNITKKINKELVYPKIQVIKK